MSSSGKAVLLFDGECGLSNKLVRVLLGKDREARLRFATLRGSYGRAALKAAGLSAETFDGLLFLPEGVGGPAVPRSDGALAALEALGGRHARLARIERKVPVVIRDFGYVVLARSWRAIFGKCRSAPTRDPVLAERFIG